MESGVTSDSCTNWENFVMPWVIRQTRGKMKGDVMIICEACEGGVKLNKGEEMVLSWFLWTIRCDICGREIKPR